MLSLPSVLTDLLHRLTRLPGIGPKAAERLALALLRWEPEELDALAAALRDAATRVGECHRCGCLAQDGGLCAVCDDQSRDGSVLCVVESALDAVALERGGSFSGRYHVLGGALSPVKGVLPEDLRIGELMERIATEDVGEVIVATNASPDGEATALYLRQELEGKGVRLTRLARGLPSGSQLDYADAATLQSALEHRTEL
jgi:recombination protein RecR